MRLTVTEELAEPEGACLVTDSSLSSCTTAASSRLSVLCQEALSLHSVLASLMCVTKVFWGPKLNISRMGEGGVQGSGATALPTGRVWPPQRDMLRRC